MPGGKLRIVWTDEARADVRSLDRDTAMRIFDGIGRYAMSGEGSVKILKGVYSGRSRLRLGDYRIFFREVSDVLRVIGVKHRREAYR
jgi:mRNA-degrading endonuclease RelE of RelBE toxin-antitoxin system